MDRFPVARYRFEFHTVRPIRLPDYAGSMLRGAFGHALRQVACMTRAKECSGCPLTGGCPYPAIFAPVPPATHALQAFSQIPVPQVIEPPARGARLLPPGETFSFHQVLIGRALRELPLIILAWQRALARGVGGGDGTAELMRVVHCDEGGDSEVYRPEVGAVAVHAAAVPLRAAGDSELSDVTLHLLTPLRLQHNGRALPPDRLQPRTLLLALARRANLLAEFHADGPLIDDFAALSDAAERVRDERDLSWLDWKRYSSRQQCEMRLGGVVGSWRLRGPLASFAPLLRLGQWLHVGKETTFGLGRYTLLPSLGRDISTAVGDSCERTLQLLERNDVN
ncbi:CRISPR system precrRNA processing endoribonuclease RAMP protein Cas6 [Accumulibacter sp.]|uniref:CRISPR system precrRNA processing endoribonuclease RAMP protein Cas6 n=1 Tax=Accumulibacter sp. TaxID=2053492 RepID=UPI0025CE54D4|nr:CRISPR system precrRNA processing endoribonuclease RAMP protein Cas6 [Accumulibacter sp.]MCM8611171.1 CRISPR system precrRNA processing endoribonuclease RAMP protein Cas6 [Accumulibacter sp.]MCM8636285.1 CRISPR system precrRNA processing endoribonuclease RAMP protein Cas6 [Accumulibacter sp.]MCM8638496.1 CRISPR system precrRNA processing endoribonuclease RAMP protein Cas6 [Accumulibacter sp.]